MENLLKAVHKCRPWVDGFNRVKYKEYFERYSSLFTDVFTKAVEEAASKEELANSFVDAIDSACKAEHFWNRNASFVDDKTMLVVYLSPMLLASGKEENIAFANVLSSTWNAKFPKESYQVANFDTIMSGFTNTIMGVSLFK